MGADFLLIKADRIDAEGLKRLKDNVTMSVVRDLNDELVLMHDTVTGVMREIDSLHDDIFTSQSREISYWPDGVYAGGMSWGDSPSDAFDDIDRWNQIVFTIEDAIAIKTAMKGSI